MLPSLRSTASRGLYRQDGPGADHRSDGGVCRGATYSWIVDGKLAGSEPTYTAVFTELGKCISRSVSKRLPEKPKRSCGWMCWSLLRPSFRLHCLPRAQGSAGCRIYLHSRYSAFGPGGLPLPMALCRRGRFYADELYLPGRGGGELPDPYRGIERRRNLLQGICRGGRGEDAFGGPLRKALITAKRPIGARSSAVRSILRRRWLISPIRSSSGRLMGNRS